MQLTASAACDHANMALTKQLPALRAVVGFSIMMWPFLFHAVLTIVELPSKMAAKKAM